MQLALLGGDAEFFIQNIKLLTGFIRLMVCGLQRWFAGCRLDISSRLGLLWGGDSKQHCHLPRYEFYLSGNPVAPVYNTCDGIMKKVPAGQAYHNGSRDNRRRQHGGTCEPSPIHTTSSSVRIDRVPESPSAQLAQGQQAPSEGLRRGHGGASQRAGQVAPRRERIFARSQASPVRGTGHPRRPHSLVRLLPPGDGQGEKSFSEFFVLRAVFFHHLGKCLHIPLKGCLRTSANSGQDFTLSG